MDNTQQIKTAEEILQKHYGKRGSHAFNDLCFMNTDDVLEAMEEYAAQPPQPTPLPVEEGQSPTPQQEGRKYECERCGEILTTPKLKNIEDMCPWCGSNKLEPVPTPQPEEVQEWKEKEIDDAPANADNDGAMWWVNGYNECLQNIIAPLQSRLSQSLQREKEAEAKAATAHQDFYRLNDLMNARLRETRQQLSAANEEIERLKVRPQWVKAADRLPNEYREEPFFIKGKDGNRFILCYNGSSSNTRWNTLVDEWLEEALNPTDTITK